MEQIPRMSRLVSEFKNIDIPKFEPYLEEFVASQRRDSAFPRW